MFGIQCLFCDHDNPVAAKYCMECGAQLTLKLCMQCEAVNDRSAASCHSCRSAFPAEPMAKRAGTADSIHEALLSSDRSLHKQSRKAGRAWRMPLLISALIMLAAITYFLYRQSSLPPTRIDAQQSAPAEASLGPTAAPSVSAGSSPEVAGPPIDNSMTWEPNADATTPPSSEPERTERPITRAPSNKAAAIAGDPRRPRRPSVVPTDARAPKSALSASDASQPVPPASKPASSPPSASNQPVPPASNPASSAPSASNQPVPVLPSPSSALPASKASKLPPPNKGDGFQGHHDLIAPPP